jgi:DNA mismatch endonuclease (patch repair protein)
LLRRLLWREGLRYRIHARTPVGRPDIAFLGARVAIFVDGCFWHGCPEHYVRPRSRNEFWAEKLEANVLRDIRQTSELEGAGWRVCRFWEHEVFENPERLVDVVTAAVRGHALRPRTSWRALRVVEANTDGTLEQWILRDLRDPQARRSVTRARTTHKWRRRLAAGASNEK